MKVSLVSIPIPIHNIFIKISLHLAAWEARHRMCRLIYRMWATSPMLPDHVVALAQITATPVPAAATSQISPCHCTSTRIKCSAHGYCARTMQRITRNWISAPMRWAKAREKRVVQFYSCLIHFAGHLRHRMLTRQRRLHVRQTGFNEGPRATCICRDAGRGARCHPLSASGRSTATKKDNWNASEYSKLYTR